MRSPRFAALLLLAAPTASHTQQQAPVPQTIAARTAQMQNMPGLLPLHWDASAGKLFLEIPQLDAQGHSPDLLYTHSLPSGVGSNDLGLDRGQLAPLNAGEDSTRIVHFERFGPKVLLVQANQAFRSSSSDPAEQASVLQSFPTSVLAGFKVETAEPNAVLVDATDFFLRDAHGVAETLTGEKQGAFHLDASRSAIALDRTRAFPLNTEVEAVLTFTSDDIREANFVSDVTPDPHALTVREHQSFMQLPSPGYAPRRYDPRAGYFPASYRDYSAPLGQPLDQLFITRHRLIKRDPACVTACEALAPIRYYVDRGAPEPIRSALVEGARWWDQAFQAAGWARGTFQVDLLPADADPMDIRFNIIQWVHRYTRGWSYGASIVDPRTSEILKGNVTLGGLRGRQDYLIAEALLSPYKDGTTPAGPNNPMLQMVLARIRQLAAHETGHTLGLAHNYAASSVSQSASVMDYPHPIITLDKQGVPDLSHAYAVDIGAWDKVAIDFGYRQFPAGTDETASLDGILTASQKAGLVYLTDQDARPFGSASPRAHLWDNGADAAAELDRVLTIRKAALARFGESAIRSGTPLAQLEDTLVPLYLFHRYQAEAAIKLVGGLDYRYNLRGDSLPLPEVVPPAAQRKALTAVLETLSPETLTLPESLLRILPPRPPGYPRTRESFASHTGLTFDPVAAAESAADLTLMVLLHPERASRLVEYHARNPQQPSLESVLDQTLAATANRRESPNGLDALVATAVHARTVEWMLALAANPQTSTQARAITRAHLDQLRSKPATLPATSTGKTATTAETSRIDEFLRDPAKFVPAKPVSAPPGMPIGDLEE